MTAAFHSRSLFQTKGAKIVQTKNTFDAIVIGSGMTGGWAAKELTEKGLKTLVLEAGRPITPEEDYVEHVPVWEMPIPWHAKSEANP